MHIGSVSIHLDRHRRLLSKLLLNRSSVYEKVPHKDNTLHFTCAGSTGNHMKKPKAVPSFYRLCEIPSGPAAVLWSVHQGRPRVLRVLISRPGVTARRRLEALFSRFHRLFVRRGGSRRGRNHGVPERRGDPLLPGHRPDGPVFPVSGEGAARQARHPPRPREHVPGDRPTYPQRRGRSAPRWPTIPPPS